MSEESDITSLDVTDLASRVREGVYSAEAVLEAYVARLERWNGTLRAVVRPDLDRARAHAVTADLARSKGKPLGPLHGVPFTLQDPVPVAGIGASAGSEVTRITPEEHGVIARRLIAAGGIFVGKTNVSPSASTPGEFGPLTANPHDVTRTAGGRSGGPCAAVAARFSAFDVGLDVSGSLRVAAHCCGVVALRPTMHRIPAADLVVGPPRTPRLDRHFITAGPVARSARDLDLLFRVLAGPHASDPEVAPVPAGAPPAVSLRGLRVAWAPESAGVPVSKAVEAALDRVRRAFVEAGAVITEACPFPMRTVWAALLRHAPVAMALIQKTEVPVPSLLPSAAAPPSPFDIAELLAERDGFVRTYEEFMAAHDVLVTPAANIVAFAPGAESAGLDLDGRLVAPTSVSSWSVLSTYIGAPALVLPAGAAPLPAGAQLLGARFEDQKLIATAAAIERLVGKTTGPALL